MKMHREEDGIHPNPEGFVPEIWKMGLGKEGDEVATHGQEAGDSGPRGEWEQELARLSTEAASPGDRRLSLEAAVGAQPLWPLLREWYVLEAETGLLLHRHCLPSFRENPRDHFCSRCAKVMLEVRGETLALQDILEPDNERCISCWFGFLEAEQYFAFLAGLWRQLLLHGDPRDTHHFAVDGAILRLFLESDVWGLTVASVLVCPDADISPAEWAASRGIESVATVDTAEIFGGLAPMPQTCTDLLTAHAEARAAAQELTVVRGNTTASPRELIRASRRFAAALWRSERYLECVAVEREIAVSLSTHFGPHHLESLHAHATLAVSLQVTGDSEGSRSMVDSIDGLLGEAEPMAEPDQWERLWCIRESLGDCHRLAERHEAAAAQYLACWTLLCKGPDDHPAPALDRCLHLMDMVIGSRLYASGKEAALEVLPVVGSECQKLHPASERVVAEVADWEAQLGRG